MHAVVPQAVVTGLGVCAHVLVPSQSRNMQSVSVQVIPVPEQTPPAHVSVWVQRLPSSQLFDRLHCHVPPAFVQMYVEPPHETSSQEWVASQECDIPLAHTPLARFTPQPVHVLPTTSSNRSLHSSGVAHAPSTV
jgi:hypothetical protein